MMLWATFNYNSYFDDVYIEKYYTIISKHFENFVRELLIQIKDGAMQNILNTKMTKRIEMVSNWLIENK